MKHHLLVVATNYLETTGGVEGHLQRLLPLLVERGVAVSISYLGAPHPPYTADDGVYVVPLSRRADFRSILAVPAPQDWRRLESVVRLGQLPAGRVTHISTQTRFFPTSWLGMRLGHRLAVPVIHTEHGGGYVATSSRLVESAARVVDLTVGRAVLRGASEVLAVSQASCEFVKRLSGVDATLFHNGVDIESWLPEATRSATASAKGRSLVFVGRLVPEKGWRSFLHIARACREAGFLGPVVLLGDGPDREKAASYAQTLGILDAQLPGHVPSAVVRDHLRGGILVNPTTASEGFQLTLVEAMACGAAIATYAVGGTEEIAAVPGAVVSVVPVGDETLLQTATLDLLSRRPSDPDLGVLWTWDWSRVADAYVAVLERASSSVGG